MEKPGPNLHDAYLTGIEIRQDDIALRFVTVDERTVELLLHSVRHFLCNDFREGNIVLDVTICDPEQIGPQQLAPFLAGTSDPYLSTLLRKIRSGEYKMVRISPSYGCEITGICQDYSVASVAS